VDLDQPSAAVRVVLAGAEATISCSDPEVRRLLASLFRHCRPAASASVSLDYRIRASGGGALCLHRLDQQLYEGKDREYLVRRLLFDLLIRLPREQSQFVSFHAAAVAREGCGVLLCGESKSGKSTLAAWLTARGFDYLSDEIAAVRCGGLEMTGLARGIVLKEGSSFVWRQRLNEQERFRVVRLSDQAAVVDPELLRGHSVRQQASLGLLLFPHFAPGRGLEARRLPQGECAMLLIEALVNSVVLPDRGVPETIRLARVCPAYTVEYSDLGDVTVWIEETVAAQTSEPEPLPSVS